MVRRDRAARDAAIGFGLWCLLWWIGTAQRDRDWVIAMPLLAWPMANGIAGLLELRQRAAILVIGGVPLIWSVVVLSAWPTSDNRILVPLNVLSPIVPASDSAGEGRGEETEDLALSVNRVWMNLAPEYRKERWLLVGSADAFRWIPHAVLGGTWDSDPWQKIVPSGNFESDEAIAAAVRTLRREGLRYLVIDWAGLSHLDHSDRRARSSTYRDRILQLQRSGVLRLIDWELPSNRAQCFEIVDDLDARDRRTSRGSQLLNAKFVHRGVLRE
jgi:hypothetical protein